MKKLFHYKVSIYKEHKYSWHKDEFIQEEVEVIAENEKYMIVKDWFFTKLEKSGKRSCGYDMLNKENISIRTNDHILDDGIFYRLYSENKTRPSTIKKHITTMVNSKFSWLVDNLDLSIIK